MYLARERNSHEACAQDSTTEAKDEMPKLGRMFQGAAKEGVIVRQASRVH